MMMNRYALLPVAALALAVAATTAQADGVGIRCTTYLYVLETGDPSTELVSETGPNGAYAVESDDGDTAAMTCSSGCGIETGDGNCIQIGLTGSALPEAVFAAEVGDFWVHDDTTSAPSTDAIVMVECNGKNFALFVPNDSQSDPDTQTSTQETTGGTATKLKGIGENNESDEARLDCNNDGTWDTTISGEASIACCDCYTPSPCP